MLSWSSAEQGDPANLSAIAAGADGAGVPLGDQLLRFASACAGTDDVELAEARAALAEASDLDFMVDAAAVAANFEMMTRLADGTGASMPEARTEAANDTITTFGMSKVTSRR
jgi:hypothetical protein